MSMTRYPCGRPAKAEGLCGPHLRGKRARENAEARRVEERERAQERMARAILVERRLSKAGIQASVQPYDDGTVVEMTIDAAERLADEVERLKATLSRVEALAEEWRWKDPGEPPAPEWEILDAASADLRRVLTGEEADHG